LDRQRFDHFGWTGVVGRRLVGVGLGEAAKNGGGLLLLASRRSVDRWRAVVGRFDQRGQVEYLEKLLNSGRHFGRNLTERALLEHGLAEDGVVLGVGLGTLECRRQALVGRRSAHAQHLDAERLEIVEYLVVEKRREWELFGLAKVADHVVGEDDAARFEHGRLEDLVGPSGDGRLAVKADVAFTLFPTLAVECQLDEPEKEGGGESPFVGQYRLQRTPVDEIAVGRLEGTVDVGGDVGDEEDRLDHVALFVIVGGRLEHDVQRTAYQTGKSTRPHLLFQTV
ncbi:hypothetical protein T09_1865, partial [Trichinella sp. T9]